MATSELSIYDKGLLLIKYASELYDRNLEQLELQTNYDPLTDRVVVTIAIDPRPKEVTPPTPLDTLAAGTINEGGEK